MVARVSEVYVGQCGGPSELGFSVCAKFTHTVLMKRLRRSRAVMVADFGIIEGERDLTGMEWARAIIQYRSSPGIDVSISRRGA